MPACWTMAEITHTHDLDDRLHEDCPMCERIRRLQPLDKRDRAAAATLAAHGKRAARSQEAARSITRAKRGGDAPPS